MAFDPTLPLTGVNVQSAVLREQLNALNDKIDAVPAGPPGADGSDGAPGADGAPGEISAADLLAERINHAANPTGVTVLGLSVSDPMTQAEGQAIVSKLDELITALRREP